ncbi:hypothetical protein NDU88_011433 [Pleurodeles waltl]|uniref:Uncharacterized protein n=1 Tax=Pleurodeles waltl TaxID=8319 RepID=A0AAV7QXL3_PLEWA|nr:hypothetical protein NDU88_011433 [Pleurodeles waltl]
MEPRSSTGSPARKTPASNLRSPPSVLRPQAPAHSQAAGAAATFHPDPGPTWHPSTTTEDNTPENGNPVIRIPVTSPVKKRTSHGREEKGVADKAGNPDIRVPKE